MCGPVFRHNKLMSQAQKNTAKQLLTDDFKPLPYWWENIPTAPNPASMDSLPANVDVLVIGAGYTGLCAALELVRGGRNTLVVDAEQPGHGCSTRNGGQISSSIKPGFAELSAQYGPALAAQVIGDGHEALRWIGDFIEREKIDCDYRRCGRFYGAHSSRVYESFATKLADQPPGVTINADIIPQAEQSSYIGSDSYHGGILYKDHSCLDPGRYHAGLLNRVLSAGGSVIGQCPVKALHRTTRGFKATVVNKITGVQQQISARQVVLATNGYSTNLVPWLRRRVIPIGSYIIATEELPEAQMKRLIPDQRVVTDSKKLVVYYRPSPDNKRIVFGARVSITESDPVKAVVPLHRELTARFPELQDTRVSHSWMGFVAYTFDSMPHMGNHNGIYYSLGYCGSGVSLSSFSGTRLARQILGSETNPPAFEQTEFNDRFYYREKPWFLAPSITWYRMCDALGL